MKKILFIILGLIVSLIAVSCQDEDFGYTEQDVFKGVYKRNFEKEFGKIDPNQSWDLSAHGRSVSKLQGTRAAGDLSTDADGFYRIESGTITGIKTEVPEGLNNASKASSFGLLATGEPFYVIPISQDGKNKDTKVGNDTNGDYTQESKNSSYYLRPTTQTIKTEDNWTLKMVVLEDGKSPAETTLWRKSTSNNIQIPNSEAITCPTCQGHAMVQGAGDLNCDVCSGNGWFAGNGESCPKCHGTKTEKGECTNCDDEGHITCTTCKGNGYVRNGTKTVLIIIPLPAYKGCPDCLVPGDTNAKEIFLSDDKKGNGIQKCRHCDGTKITDVTCHKCSGTGTMIRCTWCNGEGKGAPCPNPDCHDGQATEIHWEDIPEQYNSLATNADRFRTKPWGVYSNAPAGSVIYFYLEVFSTTKTITIVNRYKKSIWNNFTLDKEISRDTVSSGPYQIERRVSSLNQDMAVLDRINTPSNIGAGNKALILGCDSKDEATRDYNDVTFMIVSSALPEVKPYQDSKIELPSISKRYMVEDMGSKSDWDFNDIVFDVFQDRYLSIPSTDGIVSSGISLKSITRGIVRGLYATLPIRVQIGNTWFPADDYIKDPTDIVGTTIQVKGEWPKGVDQPAKLETPGWNPDFEIENISGWDPVANNIHVYVKKEDSEEADVWHATFPVNGTAPYIIATDCTKRWMEEGVNIPDSWWKPKTDTWTGK